MDVVEAEGYGGDEAFQWDLDGQTKVLLQQGARESSHCFWLLEIHPGGGNNIELNKRMEEGLEFKPSKIDGIFRERFGLLLRRFTGFGFFGSCLLRDYAC